MRPYTGIANQIIPKRASSRGYEAFWQNMPEIWHWNGEISVRNRKQDLDAPARPDARSRSAFVRTVETVIKINADPQTVWSIMDDLERYPEWNRLTSDLVGRTTVDSVVRGTLTKGGNSPSVPISPTITTIVGARELRWLTDLPGFRGEHYFLLRRLDNGDTELVHGEDFSGSLAEERWDGINASSPPAFRQLNDNLKDRAEAFASELVSLHPCVDATAETVTSTNTRNILHCNCVGAQVEVEWIGPVYHNHLCGCSKCWKPEGAVFAQTAVVTSGTFRVSLHGEKLAVVDEGQSIRRHACKDCGAHMYGSVGDRNHHFYGLIFIHPELAPEPICGLPEFAGFVSSIIETGTSPSLMAAIRNRLAALGLPSFDAFSPELMDIIAWHKVKLRGLPQPTE